MRRGLSTLEAIVAVAVLAIAMTPLLAFQTQIARTHARYLSAYERVTLERSAFAVLRELNPMQRPSGEVDLGAGARLRWSSRALTEEALSTAYPTGDGSFQVALFAVEARIARPRGGPDIVLEIERFGWRREQSATQGRLVPREREIIPP